MILDMYIDESSRNNYDYEFIDPATLEIVASMKDHALSHVVFTYGDTKMKPAGSKRIAKPSLNLGLECFGKGSKVSARQVKAGRNTVFRYYHDYLSRPVGDKGKKEKGIPITVVVSDASAYTAFRVGIQNEEDPHYYHILYSGDAPVALIDHFPRRGSGYKASVYASEPAGAKVGVFFAMVAEAELARKGRCGFAPYVSALPEEKAKLDAEFLSEYQKEESDVHSGGIV